MQSRPLTPQRAAAITKAVEGKVKRVVTLYPDGIDRYMGQEVCKIGLRLYLLDGDIIEFWTNRTVKWVLEFIGEV